LKNFTFCAIRATSKRCAANWPNAPGHAPDVVLGPTTLGVLLAYEVAKHLGVPAAYAEKAPPGAPTARMLRRPEHVAPGQRVLVVDDILTTGGSIRECLELVAAIARRRAAWAFWWTAPPGR
jgi:orotate phosphoribosyltransferase